MGLVTCPWCSVRGVSNEYGETSTEQLLRQPLRWTEEHKTTNEIATPDMPPNGTYIIQTLISMQISQRHRCPFQQSNRSSNPGNAHKALLHDRSNHSSSYLSVFPVRHPRSLAPCRRHRRRSICHPHPLRRWCLHPNFLLGEQLASGVLVRAMATHRG